MTEAKLMEAKHSDAKLSRFVYNPHSCGTTVIIQAITFQNLAFL